MPIKIRLVAPPLYVMSTTSTDKAQAIELMEKAIVAIQQKMAEFEGNMNVAMAVSGAARGGGRRSLMRQRRITAKSGLGDRGQ